MADKMIHLRLSEELHKALGHEAVERGGKLGPTAIALLTERLDEIDAEYDRIHGEEDPGDSHP